MGATGGLFFRGPGADGRTFRTFNLVDDFSREAPTIVVDHSLPGERIVRELDAVVAERGTPEMIVPEFAGKALDAWAYRRGVKVDYNEVRPHNLRSHRPRGRHESAG